MGYADEGGQAKAVDKEYKLNKTEFLGAGHRALPCAPLPKIRLYLIRDPKYLSVMIIGQILTTLVVLWQCPSNF